MKTKILTFKVATLALLVTPLWMTMRTVRQARLDSALIRSCKQLDAPSVDRLLREGADPNARDYPINEGTGFIDRVRHLISGNTRGTTALITVFESANYQDTFMDPVEVIRPLLAKGADPNVRDEYGNTIITKYGIRNRRWPKSLILLLDYGSKGELTVLMDWAIFVGDQEAMKDLLLHGADPNGAIAPDQESALEYAIANKNPSMVKLLVEHGANVNRRRKIDHAVRTPLSYAKEQTTRLDVSDAERSTFTEILVILQRSR